MIAYQINFDNILSELRRLQSGLVTLDKTAGAAHDAKEALQEQMMAYFNAFKHLGYCLQTNGILLNDADQQKTANDMQELMMLLNFVFANESKVGVENVLQTFKDFKIDFGKSQGSRPCVILDEKTLLKYFYSDHEKNRQKKTILSRLGNPIQLKEFLCNFLQYSRSCMICDPNIWEWLSDNDKSKRERLAALIKTICSLGATLEELTLVTKNNCKREDLLPGVDFLKQNLDMQRRTKIHIKLFEDNMLGHDRFLVNDLFFCAFGRGFELYTAEEKLKRDLNVFWGGPKSEFGNLWKAIKDKDPDVTFQTGTSL